MAKGSSQSGLGGDSDGDGEYGPEKSKSSKIIYYKIAATVIKSIDTVGRPGPRLWRVRLAKFSAYLILRVWGKLAYYGTSCFEQNSDKIVAKPA